MHPDNENASKTEIKKLAFILHIITCVTGFNCKLSRKWNERSTHPGCMATKPDPVLITESANQKRADQQLNFAIFFRTKLHSFISFNMGIILCLLKIEMLLLSKPFNT